MVQPQSPRARLLAHTKCLEKQMPSIRIRPSSKSFLRRLIELELFFGLPLILLKVIFAPLEYWWVGLVIFGPATIVGVVVIAFIEHMAIRLIRRRQSKASKPE